MLEDGSSYDFYQAIRLLNRLSLSDDTDGNTAPALRIRPDLNLDYPHADIASINKSDDGNAIEILATFMGLYGVSSPLPGFYTEDLLDEEWDERSASREFLDIIHYQMYPLLYQAWLKYRFSTNAIESDTAGKYWEILYSLMGLGEEFRTNEQLTASLLKYAGILSQKTRTLTGLKTILSDYLGNIKIEIEPCIERRVEIIDKQKCYVGHKNNIVGENAVIGRQVADRSGKYRISLGPLSSEDYRRINTDAKIIEFVNAVIKLYLFQPLEYEIVLMLEQGTVGPIRLGEPEHCSLGENSWMINQKNTECLRVVFS